MGVSSTLPDLRGREAELREAVTHELARVLRVDPAVVECGRPFDSYGLDSIDAVVLIGAISDRIGVDLPPELLFLYSTIDSAVEALTQGAGRPSGAVKVETSSTFWFPGGGILDEPRMVDFRATLAPDLLCEVIHVGDWREWRRTGIAMADLVDRAMTLIQNAAPSGPLNLIGYSQGGQLAYATALAAEALGRDVAHLILLDTAAINTVVPFRARFAHLIKETLDGSGPGRRGLRQRMSRFIFEVYEVVQWLVPPAILFRILDRLAEARLMGPRGLVFDRRTQPRFFGSLWQTWLQSHRGNLSSPVLLIRSDDEGPEDRNWTPYCKDLTVVCAKGGHITMFSEANREKLRTVILDKLV